MNDKQQAISKSAKCPCGSGLKYMKCCGRYIKKAERPATAEMLMRSRYTAYVLQDAEYLLKTWHRSTRPAELDLVSEPVNWNGLEITSTIAGLQKDDNGEVEFIARFKAHNTSQQLHELSLFVKENNQWFYVKARQD